MLTEISTSENGKMISGTDKVFTPNPTEENMKETFKMARRTDKES